MGKKILLLKGSPRRMGNSDLMADAFVRGAQSRGYIVKCIETFNMNVGCVACGGCYSSADAPCCMHPDFNAVAQDVLEADGIVFATPLYWFGLPAGLKKFIDNFFCFYVGGKDFGGKRSAVMCCGESTEYNIFDSVQRNIELISGFLEWSLRGQVYAGGVLDPGDITGRAELKECEELGKVFFEGI